MITSEITGVVRVLIYADGTPVRAGDVVARIDDPQELREVVGESELVGGFLEAYNVRYPHVRDMGYTLLPRDYGLEWREL